MSEAHPYERAESRPPDVPEPVPSPDPVPSPQPPPGGPDPGPSAGEEHPLEVEYRDADETGEEDSGTPTSPT